MKRFSGVLELEKLESFLHEWPCVTMNSLNPSPLSNFIERWGRLARSVDCTNYVNQTLTAPALARFIDSFSIALFELRATGALANVWHASGLSRSEARIAEVLCWFLDWKGNHGQRSALCQAVIDVLHSTYTTACDVRVSQFPEAKDLLDDAGRPNYSTSIEAYYPSDQASRIDLVIEGSSILLFLEIKVDAPEGDGQLIRYNRLAEGHSKGRSWGLVYITPYGMLPANAKDLPNTISIAWGDLARVFHGYAKTQPINNISHHIIRQFSDFINNL